MTNSSTAHVHVVTAFIHPDSSTMCEVHCYPWPGYTAARICRDPRFRACSRGRTKITQVDLSEGYLRRTETTVRPGPACAGTRWPTDLPPGASS